MSMDDDYPTMKDGERPAFIVATTPNDPLFRPSEGSVERACDLCGKIVTIALRSQALLRRFPMTSVWCLQCYSAKRKAGEQFLLRR